MSVWTWTYTHRHGTDHRVYTEYELALRDTGSIILEYLSEVSDDVTKKKILAALSEDPPDYSSARTLYGEATDEYFEITECTILDARTVRPLEGFLAEARRKLSQGKDPEMQALAEEVELAKDPANRT